MVTDVTVILRAQNNRHYRHNRHGKFRRGCKGALFKGRSLPGSYPKIAGAASLREYLTAAAGRCFRHPPRRAQQHLLMAAGCQKCFCVTFAESNKGRCWRSVRKGCDLKRKERSAPRSGKAPSITTAENSRRQTWTRSAPTSI